MANESKRWKLSVRKMPAISSLVERVFRNVKEGRKIPELAESKLLRAYSKPRVKRFFLVRMAPSWLACIVVPPDLVSVFSFDLLLNPRLKSSISLRRKN